MRLIDADAAIDAIECIVDHHCITPYQTMRAAIDHAKRIINALPSAQPEHKTGRWEPFDVPWYRCSECGAVRENIAFMENFCPNCGADMRGKEDE